jgi:amidase
LEEARALDLERRTKGPRGPLHGVPVLIKDNFDTYDMPTSAGCSVLKDSIPYADAFVVRKLRAAGAIVLAKVNMSEFASAGTYPDGYSSLGGQTRNPHDPKRSAGSSSSGTAAGVAAVFGQFGLGTDTLWSVRFPSSLNGVVGLRPTTGLMSRNGIVPLALTHDTGGPVARSVYDVAAALGVMTGVDPADDATSASAGHFETDYVRHLDKNSLRGVRIGIPRSFFGQDPETDRITAAAIATLKARGAVIVDPLVIPEQLLVGKLGVWRAVGPPEFQPQLNAYLKKLRPEQPHSLAELVARAEAMGSGYTNPPKLKALKASLDAPSTSDPLYLAAKNEGRAMTIATLKAVYAANGLDLIAFPTSPKPAHLIEDLRRNPGAAESAFNLAPATGFPELVIPSGMTNTGLPVTLSLMGLPYTEAQLLSYGYDFEQATQARALPTATPALKGETFRY